MTKKTFHDFDIDPAICDALAEDGIIEPFPIQELTLPVALDGHDVIGQARTGSGKTLGFGLPLLNRVDRGRREVQALVVTPTRELCLQVTDDFERAARGTDIKIMSIYGGVPIEPQTDTLKAGVHVVVGTPGRLLDHCRRRNLDLSTCHTLVLDEADEMLDMGFLPDVEQLIDRCADQRHTMLFSATMPTAVVNLARRYMDRPTFIRAEVEEHTIPDRMEQHFFLVHRMDKPRVLARILQTPERGLAVVFTRTKAMADRLVDDLRGYDIDAIAIHGDLRQATRERNLGKFRSDEHRHDVLVATEVAARGLDIDELTHVVNYDPPEDEKMYLHRIGRTARAGGKGVAVTFATFAEVDRVNAIRKALDLATEPIEETFSTSDELTSRFDLPDETPWEHLARSGGGSDNGSAGRRSSKGDSGRDRSSKGDGGRDRSSKNDGGKDRSSKADSGKGGSSKADRGEERGGRREDAKGGGDGGGRAADSGTASDPEEGIDGSTARRARTRTRSRSGSSEGGSKASTGSDDRGSSGGTSSKTDSSSDTGSSSGRTRARARRGARSASSDGSKGGHSGGKDGGGDRSGGNRRHERGGGGSDRKPASGDSGGSGGSQRKGSGSGRGRSSQGGSEGAGRSGGQRQDQPRPAAASSASARGAGEPGIVREVKVEHLP